MPKSETPKKSAGAGILLVAQDTGRMCFVKRSPQITSFPNTWSVIAGGMEDGETEAETAWREAHEETKITGHPTLFRLYKDIDPETNFTFFTFLAFSATELKLVLNWENTAFKWVTLEEMPAPLHPGVKRMLKNQAAMRIIKQACSQKTLPDTLRVKNQKSNRQAYK